MVAYTRNCLILLPAWDFKKDRDGKTRHHTSRHAWLVDSFALVGHRLSRPEESASTICVTPFQLPPMNGWDFRHDFFQYSRSLCGSLNPKEDACKVLVLLLCRLTYLKVTQVIDTNHVKPNYWNNNLIITYRLTTRESEEQIKLRRKLTH